MLSDSHVSAPVAGIKKQTGNPTLAPRRNMQAQVPGDCGSENTRLLTTHRIQVQIREVNHCVLQKGPYLQHAEKCPGADPGMRQLVSVHQLQNSRCCLYLIWVNLLMQLVPEGPTHTGEVGIAGAVPAHIGLEVNSEVGRGAGDDQSVQLVLRCEMLDVCR